MVVAIRFGACEDKAAGVDWMQCSGKRNGEGGVQNPQIDEAAVR